MGSSFDSWISGIGSTLTTVSPPKAPDSLEQALNGLSALWTKGGRRDLLRQFAKVLIHEFQVQKMACVILDQKGSFVDLGDFRFEVDNLVPISGSELEGILRSLKSVFSNETELREGAYFVTEAQKQYGAALLQWGLSSKLVLIWNWEETEENRSLALLELLVSALQHEMQWFFRLDGTQALVYLDDLTGLYNTRYLEVALGSELKRAQRFKTPFSLLFIDLDGFKPINDLYGHLSGSSVLTQVAHLIREVVREVDIPIRYGGDEFVILLVGSSGPSSLFVAERIRQRIAEEEFRLVDQGTVHITCSIGVASYPEHGRDLGTLLKMADENMYKSKKLGKNRVSIVYNRNEEKVR